MLLRKSFNNFLKIKPANASILNLSRKLFAKKNKDSKIEDYINLEKKYNANIYDPLPVILHKAQGCIVYDINDKCYIDFLGGYAALNTGHSHPRVLETLKEQASCLHLTSRAFYNSQLPKFGEYITRMFNYEKVLPMNTGVEGGETAIKIARKWGYLRKKIPENDAIVVMAENNFWGRTLAAVSTSTNPVSYEHYGPYLPGFAIIPFDNVKALEEALCNSNVCAFMVEPIQGEAGINVPCDNYLREVRRICTERNVLWIADEVQTGLGRTGELLACDHECVRPDLLILGKGLAGGVTPMSVVLGTEEAMHVLSPGTHGSTFGGNPLACALAITTLEVIQEERLITNAKKMGEKLRCELQCRLPKEIVPNIRGKGLLNAITINPEYGHARDICIKFLEKGVLAHNCGPCAIRFTPPLTICEGEVVQGVEMISDVIHSLKRVC